MVFFRLNFVFIHFHFHFYKRHCFDSQFSFVDEGIHFVYQVESFNYYTYIYIVCQEVSDLKCSQESAWMQSESLHVAGFVRGIRQPDVA